MRRHVVFWAVVALLLVATVGSKLAMPSVGDRTEPQMATENLRRFLAAHTASAPRPALLKPNVTLWQGWRYRVEGCEALAYPAARSGELDLQIRSHARPGDVIAFVHKGALRAAAPPPAAAWDYALYRILLPLGLASSTGGAYLILIHPRDCPAAEALPWAEL